MNLLKRWWKWRRIRKTYEYECERCKNGTHHAPYDYGPFPWIWCHETNAPHPASAYCEFLYGCNICNASTRAVAKWPEGVPELWEKFVSQHIHDEIDLKNVARYMLLGMPRELIEEARERYRV